MTHMCLYVVLSARLKQFLTKKNNTLELLIQSRIPFSKQGTQMGFITNTHFTESF
jgi:hypothetical protein